jgi:tetratricopeptide (TPR) repeat protein
MSRAARRRNQKLAQKSGRNGAAPTTVDPFAPKIRRALQLQQAGDVRGAESLFAEVLRERGDHPTALHFLGLLRYRAGDRAEAAQMIARSVELDDGNADFHNNYATVLRQENRLTGSIAHCRKALDIRPDFAFAWSNMAIALKQAGRLSEALEAAEKAFELQPRHYNLRVNLANTQRGAGEPQAAIANYRAALAMQPNDADTRYQLAWTLLEMGDLDEAAEAFRKVLAVEPRRAEAHLTLSSLKRPDGFDDEMAAMERLYNRAETTDSGRAVLAFALAKSLEDIGRFDEAFAYLETGNRLIRQGYDYSTETVREQFENVKAMFDEGFFAERRDVGHRDATPIFVLGMPRSGTTLFEQILASHRDVAALGELTTLQSIAERSLDPDGRQVPPSSIEPAAFTRTGREYVASLRRQSPDALRITDKMPGNFLLIGLIKLMLPEATIIHCLRDPASTCLSIYKTYFRNRGHQYGYDLAELGDYYRLYADLMAHWHRILPGFVHDFRYEALIADQEGESRRMIETCGLDWDPACLAFADADRPVRTASAAQVRQPIYTRSLDLWRRYEKHLGPLIERLG